ncbi:hypothetical protein K439DRAFT_1631476 [Ramaria rubella]|nr:hypothetical protein K439DRAFT_1631476 [Ramaria rubella]
MRALRSSRRLRLSGTTRPFRILYRRHPVFSVFALCGGALAVIAVALGLSILCGDKIDMRVILEQGAENASGITLLGHFTNVDVDGRQVMISWFIAGCGDQYMLPNDDPPYYDSTRCGYSAKAVDVFVDGSTTSTFSYDPKLHPRDLKTNSIVYIRDLNQFETTHVFDIGGGSGRFDNDYDHLFLYPFDVYTIFTNFLVTDNVTGAAVPLLNLIPYGSSDGFFPQQEGVQTLSVTSNGTIAPSRYVRISLQRPSLVVAFVMILFLVNWGLTFTVLYITIMAFFGNQVSESILLLPLSVIITIPTFRSLWDGAPQFGLLLGNSMSNHCR